MTPSPRERPTTRLSLVPAHARSKCPSLLTSSEMLGAAKSAGRHPHRTQWSVRDGLLTLATLWARALQHAEGEMNPRKPWEVSVASDGVTRISQAREMLALEFLREAMVLRDGDEPGTYRLSAEAFGAPGQGDQIPWRPRLAQLLEDSVLLLVFLSTVQELDQVRRLGEPLDAPQELPLDGIIHRSHLAKNTVSTRIRALADAGFLILDRPSEGVPYHVTIPMDDAVPLPAPRLGPGQGSAAAAEAEAPEDAEPGPAATQRAPQSPPPAAADAWTPERVRPGSETETVVMVFWDGIRERRVTMDCDADLDLTPHQARFGRFLRYENVPADDR